MTPQAKIMVVDDLPTNIKLLRDLLVVNGYEVVTASSGVEALQLIEKERPELVLLDVMMPGMSGYQVCQRIRENRETAFIPVVMVTSLDAAEERIKGIDTYMHPVAPVAMVRGPEALAKSRMTKADSQPWHVR